MLFYQYKEAWKESPVRLCGFEKKKVWGAFNLHELPCEGSQAACRKCPKGMKGNGPGQKALAPKAEVTPSYTVNIVFINRRTSFHDMLERAPFLEGGDNVGLIRKGYVRIGNDNIRKEGMGASTAGAFDAADAKSDGRSRVFKSPDVVAMYFKAAGKAAGAGKLVEL